jgi:serine/threonine protein kinase
LLFEPIPLIPSKFVKRRRSDDPNKQDEGQFINGIGGGGIGIVKLADFGLSKQIWFDDTKTPCGTVGYTAPEIVRDEHYSKEVDMWALGCVLYTLLCGFPPFYDDQINVLTEKVARGEFTFLQPWWDEISPEAKNCVSNLLTVNPAKRYDINQFLNDPWVNQVEFKRPKKSVYNDSFRKTEFNYSPAARVMKDAFDISNEIHRIGEEKLLKKRHLNTQEIVEEEEEEIEKSKTQRVADIESSSGRYLRKAELSLRDQERLRYQEHQRHLQEHTAGNAGFELNLTGGTIISRRRHKVMS